MARDLRQNTATRITVGPFLDKADGVTPETGLTVTSEKLTFVVDDAGVPTLVIDAAPTASGGNNDMVHIANDDAGFYDLELTAAQTNYVGRAVLALTDASTHVPVWHEFCLLPADVYDAKYAGDYASADAIAAANGARTVDGAITADQALALMLAALAGKASGLGTTTATFRDINDARDAIVATVDEDGNRTAVTVTHPS